MRVRRTQHRDANEPVVVDALERCGFAVDALPGGKGVPDLLLSRRGRWYVAEVKNPQGKNRVENTQREFADRHHAPVHILRTAEDAIDFARMVP
jgi:hypothetical protein